MCLIAQDFSVFQSEQVFDKVDYGCHPLDGCKVKSITVVSSVLDPDPHLFHLHWVLDGVDHGGLPVVTNVVRAH